MIDQIRTLMLKTQKESGSARWGLHAIAYRLGRATEDALEACKMLEKQGFLDIRIDCHCQDGHDMWSGLLRDLPEEWYYEECARCDYGDQSDDPDDYGRGYSLRLLQRDYTRVTVSFMVPVDHVVVASLLERIRTRDVAGDGYDMMRVAYEGNIGHNFRVEVCGG